LGVIEEHHLLLFLVQFGVILSLSKLIGIFFKKINQPTITGDLLIGLLIGPTILGRLLPTVQAGIFPNDHVQTTMLDTIAWIGILFLMLQTGMELNLQSIWKQKNQAVIISLSDIFIPIIIAFFPIYFLNEKYLFIGYDNLGIPIPLPDRTLFSLFIASIMTISALPITIRVLHDLKILKSDLGVLIVSALTINDIVGWLIFTIILGVFANGKVDLLYITQVFGLTVIFTVFALTAGKWFSNKVVSVIHKKIENPSSAIITFICLVGILFGSLTLGMKIHGLFGFFMAGLAIGQSNLIKEKDRVFFDNFVHSLFVPLFFVNIGLKIDFLADFDLFLVLLITCIGFFGRFLGAWLGGLFMIKNHRDRIAIGFAHTPGGEMHIVVGILALNSLLISKTVFVAIIIGAIVSSILVGPMLSLTYSLKKKQKIRHIFKQGNIYLDTEFANKDECLQFLCQKASTILKQDFQAILAEVNNRELILSSAVEHELALPHARIDNLKAPVIFYIRNSFGIDWDSPDGLLVKNVFLIFTSKQDNTQQLQILSTIATLFQKANAYDSLAGAKAPNDVLKFINSNMN